MQSARPFRARHARLPAVVLALLLAACGSSRSGGMRPLPEEESGPEGARAYYEVECDGCTVSWLDDEVWNTRQVEGRWRRELRVRSGDRLRLVVRRDRTRYTEIEARIVLRGSRVAWDRLNPGQARDRIALRHHVR